MRNFPNTSTYYRPKAHLSDRDPFQEVAFNSSYYSGIEVSIYFDSTFIDDVVDIQYQMTEQVMPIFSYASYTYDLAVS